MSRIYHDGSRQLQDRFDTRRLADRLEQRTLRDAFTDEDRAFIAALPMFFLATADEQGHPQCSYKGGEPGFVRVIDERTLAFPSFDGNGMYLSMGNVLHNAQVGMLFIDFEKQQRLRVNGLATIDERDPLMAQCPRRSSSFGFGPPKFLPTVRVTFIGCSWWSHRRSYRWPGKKLRSPTGSGVPGRAMYSPPVIRLAKPTPSTERPLTKKSADDSYEGSSAWGSIGTAICARIGRKLPTQPKPTRRSHHLRCTR